MTMNWDGRQSVVDALGKYLSDKEAAENTEVVWSIIEQAMKYSNEHTAIIDPGRSLYDFFEEAVEKLFLDDKEEEAKTKRKTILQMSEMWGAFVGSEIQKQSLKFFWMEECIDGENLFVAGTYKKVLAKIAEPAEQVGIRFGCKVKKLTSRPETDDAGPSVTLQFVDSQSTHEDTFDEVVMTAPLGWLKTNLDAFEPALPQRLQDGIGAIGYGHLDKVSLRSDLLTSTLTALGLHHLPHCFLEYIHLSKPHAIHAPRIYIRNLSNDPQRPSNNRTSASARRCGLTSRSFALRWLHILHRALICLVEPSALEPGSRQSRCAARAYSTPYATILHLRRYK